MIERLFRGSVINYKNAFLGAESQVTLKFAAESVIKTLHIKKLTKIQTKNSELKKSIKKFILKVERLAHTPLDYILALPKKVYKTLIERTREKMLYGKQDDLMGKLQE